MATDTPSVGRSSPIARLGPSTLTLGVFDDPRLGAYTAVLDALFGVVLIATFGVIYIKAFRDAIGLNEAIRRPVLRFVSVIERTCRASEFLPRGAILQRDK